MLYGGWDGGGTKTEVCLADEAGRKTASGFFGPLNLNGADPARVAETVRDGITFMAREAGSLNEIGGLVVGMAGISNPRARTEAERMLREAGWQGPLKMAGDQEIALEGAIEGHGAILIAGTGSVCYGRDPEGNLFRTGGYGYLIDDDGSGYAIARDMLKAAVRARDGRGEMTVLVRGVEGENLNRMIGWLYAAETGKKEIAAMAPKLRDALEAGDAAAKRIADRAADDLADLVLSGWRKAGMADGELALIGGILRHFPEIRERMEKKVHEVYPGIRIIAARGTPALGAARMAGRAF